MSLQSAICSILKNWAIKTKLSFIHTKFYLTELTLLSTTEDLKNTERNTTNQNESQKEDYGLFLNPGKRLTIKVDFSQLELISWRSWYLLSQD